MAEDQTLEDVDEAQAGGPLSADSTVNEDSSDGDSANGGDGAAGGGAGDSNAGSGTSPAGGPPGPPAPFVDLAYLITDAPLARDSADAARLDSAVPGFSESTVRSASTSAAQQRNLAAEAEATRVAATLAQQLGVQVIAIQLDRRGVPNRGVPEHAIRTRWGGMVVGTSLDSVRRVAAQARPGRAPLERPDPLEAFLAGFNSRPVRPAFDDGQPRFFTRDVHRFMEEAVSGAVRRPVRDERVIERSPREQSLHDFRRGFLAQEISRPQSGSSYVLLAPNAVRKEVAEQLLGVTVVGFSAAQAEDQAAHIMDAIAAFRADQKEQRAKLVAALKQLWPERAALLARLVAGDELLPAELARLDQLDQQIGNLENLVLACQQAIAELGSAEQAVQRASDDIAASPPGDPAQQTVGVSGAEMAQLAAATADAQHAVDSAVRVANTAHAEGEAQSLEWAQRRLAQPEPPAELVDAIENLPPELVLSNANSETGEFDMGPATEVPTTADQPESATSELPPEAADPSPVSIGDELEAAPTVEAPHAEGVSGSSAVQADGSEPKAAAEIPEPMDVDAEQVREVDAADDHADPPGSREPVSQGDHRSAVEQGSHGEQPQAEVVAKHASEGQLSAGDTSATDGAAPPPAPSRSASAMSLVPQTDDDGDGGGSTAASMAKKDEAADPDRIDHDALAQGPDALEVARRAEERRRVTPVATLSTDPDVLAEPGDEEPQSGRPHADALGVDEPLPVRSEVDSPVVEGHHPQVEPVALDPRLVEKPEPVNALDASPPAAELRHDDVAEVGHEPERADGEAASDEQQPATMGEARRLPPSTVPVSRHNVNATAATAPPTDNDASQAPEPAAPPASTTKLNLSHRVVIPQGSAGAGGHTPAAPAPAAAGSPNR